MKCETCGKETDDVKEVIDPYDQEICDEENLIIICDDCYQERVWDI